MSRSAVVTTEPSVGLGNTRPYSRHANMQESALPSNAFLPYSFQDVSQCGYDPARQQIGCGGGSSGIAAPAHTEPKKKLRIKGRTKTVTPMVQPEPAGGLAESLQIACSWANRVDSHVLTHTLPAPQSWVPTPAHAPNPWHVTPPQHPSARPLPSLESIQAFTGHRPIQSVAALDQVQATGLVGNTGAGFAGHLTHANAVVPPASAAKVHNQNDPPKKRRKNVSASPSGPPEATSSLDEEQLKALQQINAKLRGELEAARSAAATAQEEQQKRVDCEEARRRAAEAQVEELQATLASVRAQAHQSDEKVGEQERALAELEGLHAAMECRVGVRAPPPGLSHRDEFKQQADTASRLWGKYEAAADGGVSAAAGGAAAVFDDAAHAIVRGLQASVLLVHSGAHQVQFGAEQPATRRNDIVQGRARIKEGHGWLKLLGKQIVELSAGNAEAAAMLGEAEASRRSVFAQGASVLQKRLLTLADLEYLSFERMSIQQTVKHANTKQLQFASLRERLKQNSPASDASTAEICGTGEGHAAGAISANQMQVLMDLASDFNQARKRLEATVDLSMNVAKEAPRLQQDLHRYFKSCAALRDPALAAKGRTIAWTMAAVAGEFGCGFNANVGTLQRACELLKCVLGPVPMAGKRKADKIA